MITKVASKISLLAVDITYFGHGGAKNRGVGTSILEMPYVCLLLWRMWKLLRRRGSLTAY